MRNNLMQILAWAKKPQPWRRLLADGNPMTLIEIEKLLTLNTTQIVGFCVMMEN